MIINCTDILNKYWIFSQESGYIASESFAFFQNGRIGGYRHDNETYWNIQNGVLCLLDRNKDVTTKFEAFKGGDGKISFRGAHIPNPKITLCLNENLARPNYSETKTKLRAEIESLGWSIGDHTYGLPEFFEKGRAKFSIGKYCSIANGVKISLGNHRIDIFTSYPFASLRRYWHHVPLDIDDHSSKGDVEIGSDVWIGTGAFIGSGVRIGSGAVIGSHAVVTKDVPAYAIVVGNPGRIAKYRFDEKTIDELIRLSWWDLGDSEVDSLLPLVMSDDLTALMNSIKNLRMQLS